MSDITLKDYPETSSLPEGNHPAYSGLMATHKAICGEAATLMESKNHDYTSGSGDPFANFRGATFLGIHPVLGMQLRQQDKMQRIKTFVEKGQLKVKGESVKDAIIDQINYLVLQYAFITEVMQQEGHPVEGNR